MATAWPASRTGSGSRGVRGPIPTAARPTHRDNKLDYLTADPAYSRTGTFRATRRTDGWWDAGLLTTEGSDANFMVRTGDRLRARVCLPTGLGAWPAIWTWRDGGNEVDVFEYHPDNPDLLELSNHVRQGHSYLRHPAVRPGATIDLQVMFGRHDVVWSLDGTQVFADGQGVGARWHAYLVATCPSAPAATTRAPTPRPPKCPIASKP